MKKIIYFYGVDRCRRIYDECMLEHMGYNFFQPKIEKVIFNEPATIVIWDDGTKTVVKCCEDDVYSKETGLAMCICKKLFGNDNQFKKEFKKWIPEEEESTKSISIEDAANSLREASRKFGAIFHQEHEEPKVFKAKTCENCKFYKKFDRVYSLIGESCLKPDKSIFIPKERTCVHFESKGDEIELKAGHLEKNCLTCKHVVFNEDLCKYQCYSIRRVSTDLPDEFTCTHYKPKGDSDE